MQKYQGELILLITAIIWGFAFVFQSTASAFIGPFTFNGLRFLVGAISLVPILKFNRKGIDYKKCFKLGTILGLIIASGAILQQFGIAYTTAGKAGFITSLYMVIVPILGFIFYKNKTNINVIIAIVLSTIGLYLINGASFDFKIHDIVIMLSAICFAIHILFIDRYGKDTNSVALSFIQYLVGGTVSIILALLFEDINLNMINNSLPSILYTGILSTGVAYTLQIIGQKNTEPAVASIILSLESVVSVIGGFLILNETLSFIEILGCGFMFIGVLMAQRKGKNENT